MELYQLYYFRAIVEDKNFTRAAERLHVSQSSLTKAIQKLEHCLDVRLFNRQNDIMEGLNRVVQAGKARYIGISNCYAYQLAKANALAEKEGFAKFVSVQGHYNLIFREEEREMAKLCEEDRIAMTPYSALAGGRLAKHSGETSKRMLEDGYAKLKYDATAGQDSVIIDRVAELAEKRRVTMTEVSLAWLLTKVTAPVVGATKLHHIEGAAKAADLKLSAEEMAYLEEPYIPHRLVGVMAQNTLDSAKKSHVWSAGNQEI